MNCKQGELAIVVGRPQPTDSRVLALVIEAARDRIVRLTRFDATSECWIFEEPIVVDVKSRTIFGMVAVRAVIDGTSDDNLRPIRGGLEPADILEEISA